MAKDKKKEITTEHVFTVPLRSQWKKTRRVMRVKRSVSALKSFIMKNTRAKSVKISTKLNDALWTGGAQHPPPRIRVKASVDSEGLASVKLPDEITLEEEKKKFLEEKKAKGKPGDGKETGNSDGKGEEPSKMVEVGDAKNPPPGSNEDKKPEEEPGPKQQEKK